MLVGLGYTDTIRSPSAAFLNVIAVLRYEAVVTDDKLLLHFVSLFQVLGVGNGVNGKVLNTILSHRAMNSL